MATKKAPMDKPKKTPAQKQQFAALAAVDEALAPKRRSVHGHKQLRAHHPLMPYLVAALVISLGILAFAVFQAPSTQKFTAPQGNMSTEAQAAIDTLEQSAGQLDTSSLGDATLSESSFTQ